ncbi:MAG: glycosyltransferase family 2 protein [Candidatus Promineifilaceae bacterium]
MTRPLVSIAMSVWNPNPHWLEVAIDSAFHESLCRIELVLVDDGSDGPQAAWLSSRNAERVRVITIPHRGLPHARNVGLDHCHGDFIRFLDGDDVIVAESTSALLALSGRERPIVTYGSTVLCDVHLHPQATVRARPSGCIHLKTALGRFKSTLPAMLMPHEVIERVGGFDERLMVQQDWDFVLRVSETMDFRAMRRPVYLYRRHDNSMTSTGLLRREAVRTTVLIIKGYLQIAIRSSMGPGRSGGCVHMRSFRSRSVVTQALRCAAATSGRLWLATQSEAQRL